MASARTKNRRTASPRKGASTEDADRWETVLLSCIIPPRLLYNLDAPTVRFDAVSLGAQNGDIAMIFFAYRFSVLSNGFFFPSLG